MLRRNLLSYLGTPNSALRKTEMSKWWGKTCYLYVCVLEVTSCTTDIAFMFWSMKKTPQHFPIPFFSSLCFDDGFMDKSYS